MSLSVKEEEGIRHGGTGLGLAITKAYVELMGGVLAVSSVVGEGSTFFFELELPHGTEEDAPDDAAALSCVRRLTPGQLCAPSSSMMLRRIERSSAPC